MNTHHQTDTDEAFNRAVETVRTARSLGALWGASEYLLKGTPAWDHVIILGKRGGGRAVARSFFKDLGNPKLAPNAEEAEGGRLLNEKVQQALRTGDLAEIGAALFVLAIRHFEGLRGITLSKDFTESRFHRAIVDQLSPDMLLPFAIMETLAMTALVESIPHFTPKEQDQYLELLIGLWFEMNDLFTIEHDLKRTNPRRRQQIEHLQLPPSPVLDEYYEIIETVGDPKNLQQRFRSLIEKDSDFLDPYARLADLLIEEENYNEAEDLLNGAFRRAIDRIVDRKGNWPKRIDWAWIENRHLVRAIDRKAWDLWEGKREEYALEELYRKLLKSNSNDNIGARYNILAIKLGYSPGEVEDMFPASRPGFVDAMKMNDWFRKHAQDFPQELGWWLARKEE